MTTLTEARKTWRVSHAFHGRSIKDFLLEVAEFSRQIYKKVRMGGQVLVNGEECELRNLLRAGDLLTVIFPEEERGRIDPAEGPLAIVYEDEDVLVVDKPSGLPAVPPFDHSTPSLASYLLHYYEQRKYPFTVHIVTRLDRDTSGLMLVAKHTYSHMLLTKELKKVERRYQAIVEGNMELEKGKIDEPIAREMDSIIKRKVAEDGRPSQTLFQIEKQLKDYTWIRLQLLTGRTHQVRVHMSYLDHPLAGDTLYGGKEVEGIAGQALHCYQLHFFHPWTKKRMTIVSDPPAAWNVFSEIEA
ncbi:RluA family pseudouridine synthase [Halobacillus sp. H74]|uniref:RluA family pseudouridine synthase n=1 Tax=Halobacillus sp. H74 TaxID=3457436 RepID=UPI003FCC751C